MSHITPTVAVLGTFRFPPENIYAMLPRRKLSTPN